MSVLPGPLRATIGLVALAVKDARDFPTRAVELPVLAAGTALRLSARVQHQYLGLVSRGDEVLLRIRGVPDEAPPWATFDESPVEVVGGRTERAGGSDAVSAGVVPLAGRVGAAAYDDQPGTAGVAAKPATATSKPGAKSERSAARSKATAAPALQSAAPAMDAVPVTRASRPRRRTKPAAPRDRPPSAFDQVADDPILSDES